MFKDKIVNNIVKNINNENCIEQLKVLISYLRERKDNREELSTTINNLQKKIENSYLSRENKEIMITRILDFQYGQDIKKIIKGSLKNANYEKDINFLTRKTTSANGLSFLNTAHYEPCYILTELMYFYSLYKNVYLLKVIDKKFKELVNEEEKEKVLSLTSEIFNLMLKEYYDHLFQKKGLKNMDLMEDDFIEYTQVLKNNAKDTFLEDYVLSVVEDVRYDKIQLFVYEKEKIKKIL
tara:strand:- start:9890 stop:10603 length:714 start_codon:yes stop_codon:yes gene_type:complete